MELKVGDVVALPWFLGDAMVELIDEYRPGLWQVKSLDSNEQFVISNHVLRSEGKQ
jgi:hypothetical protein